MELEIGSLTATACKKSFTGSRQDTADINSRDFRSAELRALLNELTVRWSMMLSRNSLFRQQADGFIDARQPDVVVLHPWAVILPKFSEKRLYWTKDT